MLDLLETRKPGDELGTVRWQAKPVSDAPPGEAELGRLLERPRKKIGLHIAAKRPEGYFHEIKLLS